MSAPFIPVEPFDLVVFGGTGKRRLHGGRFLLKGRAKADGEPALLTIAFNVKRITSLHGARKIIAAA